MLGKGEGGDFAQSLSRTGNKRDPIFEQISGGLVIGVQ